MKRMTLLVVMALVLTAFPMMGAGATGNHPALTPETVSATVAQGGSFDVVKTVHTPEIPPNPAIVFLADTTGSMSGALANVKANATAIMTTVQTAQPTAQFAAAQYRDFGDAFVYNLDAALTPTIATVQAAIGAWSAGGGGDIPEAQLNALTQLAGLVFPDGSTPIVVWFGDASGHDPSGTATLASTIAALQAAGITVIAINVPGADGLDATGQATAIANATGGVYLSAASSDDVAAAILTGLSNLPAEVGMASNCADPISTTFAPASLTVTSGDDAGFTETITVAADAAPGVYVCQDWALIDGEPMTDADGEVIFEEKSITVGAAFCDEGVNPAGKTPKAPGTGQNEDGFYLIGASADGLTVELIDDGSGTVFGPFASGTNIKYTENDDDISIKAGPGAVDWKIKGLGDATVRITDGFGNEAFAACLVPPAPK
ncbi:MAG: VWA domain-containing protein [Acidimicrobiia bacterium]|nr:VWA domain-containing protein [Acidimicrobiia bacterium]